MIAVMAAIVVAVMTVIIIIIMIAIVTVVMVAATAMVIAVVISIAITVMVAVMTTVVISVVMAAATAMVIAVVISIAITVMVAVMTTVVISVVMAAATAMVIAVVVSIAITVMAAVVISVAATIVTAATAIIAAATAVIAGQGVCLVPSPPGGTVPLREGRAEAPRRLPVAQRRVGEHVYLHAAVVAGNAERAYRYGDRVCRDIQVFRLVRELPRYGSAVAGNRHEGEVGPGPHVDLVEGEIADRYRIGNINIRRVIGDGQRSRVIGLPVIDVAG